MRAPLLLACALFAPVFLVPGAARACSCMPRPPPAEALEKADLVFEGRTFSRVAEGEHVIHSFEVLRSFKGEIGSSVSIRTHADSAQCGREFDMGTRYVVYARLVQGAPTDNLCSRTRPASTATEDLAFLGAGRSPTAAPVAAPAVEPPRVAPVEPPPQTQPASARGCAIGEAPAGLALVVLPAALAQRTSRRRGQC